MSKLIHLSELAPGVPATVQSIDVEDPVNQRLLVFGLAPGIDVEITHVAPFGDPVSLSFGSQKVMVRRADAERILVKPLVPEDK